MREYCPICGSGSWDICAYLRSTQKLACANPKQTVPPFEVFSTRWNLSWMSGPAFRGSMLAAMLANGWGPYNLVEKRKLWEPQPKKVEYHTPFMNAPVCSLTFLVDQLDSENIRRVITVRTYFWTIRDQVTLTTRQLSVMSTSPILLRFDIRTRQSFKGFIVGGSGLIICENPVQVCLAEIVFTDDVRKYCRLLKFTTTITIWSPKSTGE